MGGLAFADENPPLPTPRMPTAIYTSARESLLVEISKFYREAECPIEAPSKADYGDIDILVTGPYQPITTAQLAIALKAIKHKTTSGSPTTHFAIPWPTFEHVLRTQALTATDKSTCVAAYAHNGEGEQNYLQLDLHLCTADSFAWELFHQSHGDLWNILGSTLRPLGLTPSNSGLYVRIREIEAWNKNAARVLLTTSPGQTLRFLGLDEEVYWRRFDSVEALFGYAARCRFFDPGRWDGRAKGEWKANDRARARKRALFRRWVEEYLPAHVGDAPADPVAASWSREEVVQEAVEWFWVVDEFRARKREGLRGMGRERMWKEIRKELDIEGESVGAVIRGVKRGVVCEGGKLEGELTMLQRTYAEDEFDTVVQLVRENWKEIEEKQRAYERERSTQNLLAKLDRQRLEGGAESDRRLGKT